jgi:hypothetical protein
MKRGQLMLFLFLVFLVIPASAHAQAWPGITSLGRLTSMWSRPSMRTMLKAYTRMRLPLPSPEQPCMNVLRAKSGVA